MLDMVVEIFRYLLTLLFGVFVSASFLGVRVTKKNIMILSGFSILAFGLQGLLFFTKSSSIIFMIYPLITHMPFLLLMIIVFNKKLIPSIIAVTTAYLCCQICNWVSIIPASFEAPVWVVNGTYSMALILTFLLIIRFVSAPVSSLLTKPTRSLISFCIIPVFYYVFDYTSTVYTKLLYIGNRVVVEFAPFLLCICYLVFCVVYFKQYEEKQEIENRSRLMKIKQEQSAKEIETIKRSERAISLLRHDMRHFLNTISDFIENGELEKAQKYIHSIIVTADKTVNKRYCSNNTVNMILSSYENVINEKGIDFQYTLCIPKELPISDVDMTSILSNALENAVNAVLILDENQRFIELNLMEKNGKILFSLENSYAVKPKLVDGMPISKEKEHGFGTQSIRYTTEKLNGNCQFLVTEDRFILQIVL